MNPPNSLPASPDSSPENKPKSFIDQTKEQLKRMSDNIEAQTPEEVKQVLQSVLDKKDTLQAEALKAGKETVEGFQIQLEEFKQKIQQDEKFKEAVRMIGEVTTRLTSYQDSFHKRMSELVSAVQESGTKGWGKVGEIAMNLMHYLADKWEGVLDRLAFLPTPLLSVLGGANLFIGEDRRMLADSLKKVNITSVKGEKGTNVKMKDITGKYNIFSGDIPRGSTERLFKDVPKPVYYERLANMLRTKILPDANTTSVTYAQLDAASNELYKEQVEIEKKARQTPVVVPPVTPTPAV